MSKPDWCPQGVWNKAVSVDSGFFAGHRGLYVDDIARAILAATVEEMGACAITAEMARHPSGRKFETGEWLSGTSSAAAAIRERGET